MNAPPRASSSANVSNPLVAELVETLANRLQAGEAIDVDAFIAEHPECADALRRLLPAIAVLADLGRSVGSGDAPGIRKGDEPAGVLGDYRIHREVGRGGMGIVYEAEQISLRRRVALKVLPFAGAMDPRHLQRFKNEAQAAANLHHTNIVPVYSVGCERGVHYYAMQLIEGQTLAAVIRDIRRRERGEDDLVAWGQQLEKEPDRARPLIVKTMTHWQRDTDFAGVRGETALAKLPEVEREEWRQLWADVETLRQRVAKTTPPKARVKEEKE